MFKKIYNHFNTESGRREVQIQSIMGNLQIITADFDESAEDWDSLTEKQLIDKAIDWQYRTFMLGKFVNEAVDITETKAKEVTELAEKLKKVFADSESELASFKERSEKELDSIKDRSKTVQGGLIELTMTVYDHEDRITILEGGDLSDEGIEATDNLVDNASLELEGGE